MDWYYDGDEYVIGVNVGIVCLVSGISVLQIFGYEDVLFCDWSVDFVGIEVFIVWYLSDCYF